MYDTNDYKIEAGDNMVRNQAEEEEELSPDELVQNIMMEWRTPKDAGKVNFIN